MVYVYNYIYIYTFLLYIFIFLLLYLCLVYINNLIMCKNVKCHPYRYIMQYAYVNLEYTKK